MSPGSLIFLVLPVVMRSFFAPPVIKTSWVGSFVAGSGFCFWFSHLLFFEHSRGPALRVFPPSCSVVFPRTIGFRLPSLRPVSHRRRAVLQRITPRESQSTPLIWNTLGSCPRSIHFGFSFRPDLLFPFLCLGEQNIADASVFCLFRPLATVIVGILARLGKLLTNHWCICVPPQIPPSQFSWRKNTSFRLRGHLPPT